MLKNTQNTDKFLSILSDGTMRLSVPEGTEGAVKREYETSDGKTGTKYELVYTELSGTISKIAFWDGDFGKLLQLTVTDGEEDPIVLSIGTASSFGEDIMKKLPAIDLLQPVVIAPYAFEDDKGKKRKGVTLKQGDKKIESFYYDKETKKNTNGLPDVVLKKKMTSDDWKMYFLSVRLFLIDDLSKRFNLENTEAVADKKFEEFNKEEDVPFD